MGYLNRRRFVQGAVLMASSKYVHASNVADLVLFNGEVHTVDARNTRAQAIAITGNKVLAVGSNKEINAFAGSRTRVIDLKGRSVLPGINDSHLHLMGWGLSRPPFALDLTYPGVKSIADCVEAVKQAAQMLAPGEWIIGRGWDEPYFEEARAPLAKDLDAVSPHNPVVLTDFSGHAVWANSLALSRGDITASTVPPPGGVIVRNDDGTPSGVLFEGAAWLLKEKVPALSDMQQRKAIEAAMTAMLARGVTSCTEPGLSPEDLALYNDIAASGLRSKMRVTGLVMAGSSVQSLNEALAGRAGLSQKNTAFMRMPGVKIMGDGIPTANETAWLHEPYESGGNGSLLIEGANHVERVEQLNQMIAMIHTQGLQVGAHVTGDKSIDTVVAVYIEQQRLKPRKDPRHYLIHADLVSEATLARMAAHNIGANFNPEIKHLIADSQVHSIGPNRAAYEWPYRSALDAGVVVASSSDAPVTPANWLQGLATCVDRRGKQTGKVSGPAQRITLDEAIRTYTQAAAWQDHSDHIKGTLQAGMLADLCVTDERLSSIASEKYAQVGVALTLIDGHIAHEQNL